MDNKEIEKVNKFYENLIEEDEKYMKKVASEFIKEHSDLTPEELYIQGWRKSIEQPLSRSIHLIGMYTQDHIPDRYQKDMRRLTTHILEIFRNKLHKLKF